MSAAVTDSAVNVEVSSHSASGLMLLADGRFPSGGHAHSNGYEPADRLVGLATTEAIDAFLANRLTTSGVADAALVAWIVASQRSEADHSTLDWISVDSEVEARLPGPALRSRSRGLGRQWLRAGRRLFGDLMPESMDLMGPDGPHEVVGFAVVAHAVGLDPTQAALVHLHHLVSGVTTAAVRLRGLDPYAMQGLQLRMLPLMNQVAVEAASMISLPLSEIPAPTGPLFEFLTEDHAQWDNKLFQS